MKAHFRLSNCLAGDPDLLLSLETEDGYTAAELYCCTGLFKIIRLRNLKQKMLEQAEISTGRKYTEA